MSAWAAKQYDGGLLPPTGIYSAQYHPPTSPDPGGSVSAEPRKWVSRSQGSNLGGSGLPRGLWVISLQSSPPGWTLSHPRDTLRVFRTC